MSIQTRQAFSLHQEVPTMKSSTEGQALSNFDHNRQAVKDRGQTNEESSF